VSFDIGDLAGAGSFSSPASAMEASLSDFVGCTGVDVKVSADPALDADLVNDAVNGTPPDVAVIDGPTLLPALATTGTLAPAPPLVEADLDKLWDVGWRSTGSVNGVVYATPLDASVRSLVWYSPKWFGRWSLTAPTTWGQLVTLSAKATAAGHGWCLGSNPGGTVRSLLAEVVLRQAGTPVYDGWSTGSIESTDPLITAALTTVGSLVAPRRTRTSAATASDITAVESGSCALALDDGAGIGAVPKGGSVGPGQDLYAFPLPPIGPAMGTPVRVNAHVVVALADRPEVQALRYYLSTALWAARQYTSTGRISANRGLDIADITDPITRLEVAVLQQKTAVSRFDAFAVMPAAESATAGTELADWIAGRTSAAAALRAIQAARPAS
jgi:alpha-glucoside transport system substrate-binding protein